MSLLIHFGGYWFGKSLSLEPTPPRPASKPIEVALVQHEPETQKTMAAPIHFADAPKELIDDSLEALKKKTDILSEKLQRVKREMLAKESGLTKNRSQTPKLKTLSMPNLMERMNNKGIPPTDAEKDDQRKQQEQQQMQQSQPSRPKYHLESFGPSTFGNKLNRSIEVGDFTALNTDRHLYYSFFARIEEMIRPPWEDQVSTEAKRLSSTAMLRPKGGWSTRLDVILRPNGQVDKVVLLKSSGITNLDNAATEAFQKAGFFPNPPKEMVNEEGIIVLKYIFTVY